MSTANDVLNKARGEIGYSRWTDPEKGTKYGRWYAKKMNSSYYGESGVPYCAMFVSWVFDQVGQTAPGLPGAYCPWIVTAGRNAVQTVATKNATAGDIVLFDWEGDGVSDHVGIVESNNGSYLTCIEGNTTGTNGKDGGVNRRTRAYSTVICIIRPKYGTAVNTPPAGTSSGKKSVDEVAREVINGAWSTGSDRKSKLEAAGYNYNEVQSKVNQLLGYSISSSTSSANAASTASKIAEDGLWGIDTSKAFQKTLGTTVDGIISSQDASIKSSNTGLLSTSWSWVSNPKGSEFIRAMQIWLKNHGFDPGAIDGLGGPNTFKALQRYAGTTVDGYFSNPSTCIKALQKKYNQGTLFK